MKKCVVVILTLALPLLIGCAAPKLNPVQSAIRSEPIIIDHSCTAIDQIPDQWIEKAKTDFGISYGHTSHGSQIVSGMEALQAQNSRYAFGSYSSKSVLTLFDREPRGDLGNPDRTTWAQRTRDLLEAGWGDTNIVMWSWCGQVSSATREDIETYLLLMDQLERDYPQVVFIYMTGHLDGTGEAGNLHARNDQIRAFCRSNNKILYDFADIESYDPDGNEYLTQYADDGCNYEMQGHAKNWADEWCLANPDQCSLYSCAHSNALNCDQKARAFWCMMARLAGWDPKK